MLLTFTVHMLFNADRLKMSALLNRSPPSHPPTGFICLRIICHVVRAGEAFGICPGKTRSPARSVFHAVPQNTLSHEGVRLFTEPSLNFFSLMGKGSAHAFFVAGCCSCCCCCVFRSSVGVLGEKEEYSFRSDPAGGTGIFVGAEEQGKQALGWLKKKDGRYVDLRHESPPTKGIVKLLLLMS